MKAQSTNCTLHIKLRYIITPSFSHLGAAEAQCRLCRIRRCRQRAKIVHEGPARQPVSRSTGGTFTQDDVRRAAMAAEAAHVPDPENYQNRHCSASASMMWRSVI